MADISQSDFWLKQLELAVSRHDRQADRRFERFRLLFGLHGLVLTALVFKAMTPDKEYQPVSKLLAIMLACGVFVLGTLLYAEYVKTDLYVRTYKTWIEKLEHLLLLVSESRRVPVQLNRSSGDQGIPSDPEDIVGHNGTLYLDRSEPRTPTGSGFYVLSFAVWIVNTGVPLVIVTALLRGQGVCCPIPWTISFILLSAVTHVLIVFVYPWHINKAMKAADYQRQYVPASKILN